MSDKYSITIVGLGTSSLCFLLYLYENNYLEKFEKILVLEKEEKVCFSCINYKNVYSNSAYGSLISVFENNDFYENKYYNLYKKYNRDKCINLFEFNLFLQEFYKTFEQKLINNNVEIIFNYNVNNVFITEECITINEEILTDKIVFANGAKQTIQDLKSRDKYNFFSYNDNIVLSDHIYNYTVDDFRVFKDKHIIISGSSHGSMSVLNAFIEKNIDYSKITLLVIRDFKVYFSDETKCDELNYQYCKDDICTETGKINRFDGLREKSKELFLNLHKYKNIEILKYNESEIIIDYIKQADFIIPCWGYEKIYPDIYYHDKLLKKFNVNENLNLVSGNMILNKCFSIGLSSNPKIKNPQKSFDKSLDGIWIYKNVISPILAKNVVY
jgi:hypothetical protein